MQNNSQCSSFGSKMYKFFIGLSMFIAITIGVLSIMPQQATQMYAAYATHFFVGLLPVLGTAALLKYIVCCSKKAGKCCNNGSGDTTKKSCEN